MAQTTEHLFLIHDGARYHTSAATQAVLAANRDRITLTRRTKTGSNTVVVSVDEALVFKVYDSEKDGRARFTPHTSFDDPTTPPGAPPPGGSWPRWP